jgi:hypothetical protein
VSIEYGRFCSSNKQNEFLKYSLPVTLILVNCDDDVTSLLSPVKVHPTQTPRNGRTKFSFTIAFSSPVQTAENTAVENCHADHGAPSIRKSWHELRRQAAVARSV